MTYFSGNGGISWEQLPEMPTARMHFAMAVDKENKKVYVAGGVDAGGGALHGAEVPSAASSAPSSQRHPRAGNV